MELVQIYFHNFNKITIITVPIISLHFSVVVFLFFPTGSGSTVGWSDLFLIWQKTALNQRSGIILEVQIQIFGARQSFHFFKISGGLNINIFL